MVTDAEKKMVFSSQKYLRWKERIENSGSVLEQVELLAVVSRLPGSWYAVFLDCRLRTPEGHLLPRCIAVRGESVAVIPVLTCIEDGVVYTLMVEQRSICDGDVHIGFPAGNGDESEGDLRAMACRELQEELELEVEPDELQPLFEQGVSINPSLTDDLVYFYYFERTVSSDWLHAMEGLNTGHQADGEFIKVRVLPIREAFCLPTASTLIGLRLLEHKLQCRL